ncbi:MAG: anti-sigma regulatory factor [Eubacterium sp.]|nr:anti-sigma regulatory factor [Eubacterium sp.]
MSALSLKFDIPGDDFTRAGEASSAIKKKLKQMGLSPNVIRNISIAAYEGEINAVIHGGANLKKTDHVQPTCGIITVLIDEKEVTVIIEDSGKGIYDIEKAMQEGFTTAPDEIRSLGFGAGMGLPNMKKYSDEIYVQSEVGVGTKVTMKFYL